MISAFNSWDAVLLYLRCMQDAFLIVLRLSSLAGITVFVGLVADCITAATYHLRVLHRVLSKMHRMQVSCAAASRDTGASSRHVTSRRSVQTSLLWSLFNLFRGRKVNVLRHRVDTAAYSIEQVSLHARVPWSVKVSRVDGCNSSWLALFCSLSPSSCSLQVLCITFSSRWFGLLCRVLRYGVSTCWCSVPTY